MSTYYEILGITENATLDEIRIAKKKLLFEFHIDRHQQETEEMQKFYSQKTKEITEAATILMNPELKKQYDESRLKINFVVDIKEEKSFFQKARMQIIKNIFDELSINPSLRINDILNKDEIRSMFIPEEILQLKAFLEIFLKTPEQQIKKQQDTQKENLNKKQIEEMISLINVSINKKIGTNEFRDFEKLFDQLIEYCKTINYDIEKEKNELLTNLFNKLENEFYDISNYWTMGKIGTIWYYIYKWGKKYGCRIQQRKKGKTGEYSYEEIIKDKNHEIKTAEEEVENEKK